MTFFLRLKEFEEWLNCKLRLLNADEEVFTPYIQSLLEDTEDEEDRNESLDDLLVELVKLQPAGHRMQYLPKSIRTEDKISSPPADFLHTDSSASKVREEIVAKWKFVLSGSEPIAQQLPEASGYDDSAIGTSSRRSRQTQSTEDEKLDRLFRDASANIEEENIRYKSGKSSTSLVQSQPDSQQRTKILSHTNDDSGGDSDEQPGSSKKKSSDSSLSLDVGRQTNLSKVINEQRDLKDRLKVEAAKKKERDKNDRAKQKALSQERKEKAKKKAAKMERKR